MEARDEENFNNSHGHNVGWLWSIRGSILQNNRKGTVNR
jgi:hypothetical protein